MKWGCHRANLFRNPAALRADVEEYQVDASHRVPSKRDAAWVDVYLYRDFLWSSFYPVVPFVCMVIASDRKYIKKIKGYFKGLGLGRIVAFILSSEISPLPDFCYVSTSYKSYFAH